MTSRTSRMVAAARACLGTPFHHQGRLPQHGLDCIGLVIMAMQAADYQVRDQAGYARWPVGTMLEQALIQHGACLVPHQQAGDVLLFALAGVAQHVALCSGVGHMIHAYAPVGAVVETQISPVWQRRLVGVYRFEE